MTSKFLRVVDSAILKRSRSIILVRRSVAF